MRTLLTIFLGLLPFMGAAQILEPATWKYEFSTESASVGDEIEVVFNVTIERGWYMYSNDFDPDVGPILTEVIFAENGTFELAGDLIPIKPKRKYDESWPGEVSYFINKAQFRQKIKILSEDFSTKGVSGDYSGQVCTTNDGKCIPFFGEFSLAGLAVTGEKAPQPETSASTEPKPAEEPNATQVVDAPTQVVVTPAPTATDGTEEVETPPSVLGNSTTSIPSAEESPSTIPAKEYNQGVRVIGNNEDGKPIVEMDTVLSSFEKDNERVDYWGFMLVAFLAGLTALLTPCVFPMIPLTVSFFTNKGGKGGALFYGASIVVIYSLIGVVLAPFMGAETANHLSTEWLPNMIFFIVFLVFALSFFGLFEITLPSRFVNKMDQQSDRKGLIGIFFMAFTLVLVSFSCTGPIVGSILVESAGGQKLKPILGMAAFSAAFAIPFTLFAMFPSLLKSLPKSGGWLNSVKVFLGFIELALAFKFFSIADLAYNWGLLDREINLAIWITLFTLLGLYLLGKLRLPGDSKMETIPVFRLLLAIASFTFVVYLMPGMFGAPLKAMAGLLPPTTTHDFDLVAEIRESTSDGTQISDLEGCEEPLYSDFLEFPHGIQGYFDFEQAMACARAQDKPLFIDFTGHGCVNCRKMEDNVWSDERVLAKLKEDFVVLALYVDDKTVLEESAWYESAYDGKVKRTLGLQNMDFEIQRINNNAQPYYVILDHNEQALSTPTGYEPKVPNFVKFLDEANQEFQNRQNTAVASTH